MTLNFRFVFALIVALLMFTAFSPVASAQAIQDNVSVSAGAVRVSEGNVVASGTVEVQKTLGSHKLLLDSTLRLTDLVGDGTGQVLANTTVLRGYLGEKFFVAGGVSLGSRVNTGLDEDMFLNPTVQTGVTLPAGSRLVFEPSLQLDTPDVLSANPARALTANLTTTIALSEKFGLKFDAGISQVRADNRFLKSGGQNIPYGLGGLYFNF